MFIRSLLLTQVKVATRDSPGEGVRVAGSSDDTSLVTESGTSFAAAAVAGVAIRNLVQIREVCRGKL